MSVKFTSKYFPISTREIAAHAPAIVSPISSNNCNPDHYNFISSIKLIDAMGKKGFYPFSIQQSTSHTYEKMNFARHAISFRHESTFDNMRENDIVPQIVILNSHDKSCAYKIYCGFFRFVCCNGLIVGDNVDAFAIRHYGVNNTLENIIDVSFEILDNSMKIMPLIDEWKKIELNNEQRMELAYNTFDIKFNGKDTPIKAEQFLTPRNEEDYNNHSLWSTYNVLQENLIKGGLEGMNKIERTKPHQRIKVTTKTITNIKDDIEMNTKLWNYANDMYESIAA